MSPDAPSLQGFIEGWSLFAAPVYAAMAAGAVLGLLGVYVVLRRMVFLSAAVAQVASLGVVLGLLTRGPFPPLAWATTLALLALIFLARPARRGPHGFSSDSRLGLLFLLGSAGTIALGSRIVEELHDVESLLLGSAVAVGDAELALMAAVAAALLLLHAWAWRGFSAVSFDRGGARVRGLPVVLLESALMASLALSISTSTQVLGALPTFAFSVLPALGALSLAPNLPWALLGATILGALSGALGYLLAYLLEFSVGAAQALTAAGLFGLCWSLGQWARHRSRFR